MADLSELENKLGIKFKNTSLLEKALVHSSYANENPYLASESNERLEFLGDAVLGMLVAESLYDDYPQHNEGMLTKMRSILVRSQTLAKVAGEYGLGDFLYLGKGERQSGGQDKEANLACSLEAVIAAIYLDQGLEICRKFINRAFSEEADIIPVEASSIDYKSRLQEAVQAYNKSTPKYKIVSSEGPPHNMLFTAEVSVNGKAVARGSGSSKRRAEAAAAKKAISVIGSTLQQ